MIAPDKVLEFIAQTIICTGGEPPSRDELREMAGYLAAHMQMFKTMPRAERKAMRRDLLHAAGDMADAWKQQGRSVFVQTTGVQAAAVPDESCVIGRSSISI